MTYIAYIDETGDTGPVANRGSGCYALGCVLLDLDVWPEAFDNLLTMRRHIRTSFGVPLRQELKANFLIRNNGGLRQYNLAPSQRNYIYRTHLRALRDLPAQAFAVVVDKRLAGVDGAECFEMTWTTLLQRLQKFTAETAPERTLVIAHDEGENDRVRRLVRRARRHLTAGSSTGQGSFRFKADRFLEDPVPRDSSGSYFVQMADLVAYAGWRSYIAPSAAVKAIVHQAMWSEIGTAARTIVNYHRPNGSVPGVVLRTR